MSMGFEKLHSVSLRLKLVSFGNITLNDSYGASEIFKSKYSTI